MAIRRYSRRRSSRSSRSTRSRRVPRYRARRSGRRTSRSGRYAVSRSTGRVRAEVKVMSAYTATGANPDPNYNLPSQVLMSWDGTAQSSPVVDLSLTNRKTFVSTRAILLTGIRGGYAANERVGLSVQPRSLQVRLGLYPFIQSRPVSALLEGDPEVNHLTHYIRTRFRVILYQDKEWTPNVTPALPQWSDIFTEGPLIGGTLRTSVNSFMRLDNAGRFKIMSDRSYSLDGDTPQGYPSLSLNLRGMDLRWRETGVSAIRTGHIFMMVAAQTETSYLTTDAMPIPRNPLISYESRLSYTDA